MHGPGQWDYLCGWKNFYTRVQIISQNGGSGGSWGLGYSKFIYCSWSSQAWNYASHYYYQCVVTVLQENFCRLVKFWLYVTAAITHYTCVRPAKPLFNLTYCLDARTSIAVIVMMPSENVTSNALHDGEWHPQTPEFVNTGSFIR